MLQLPFIMDYNMKASLDSSKQELINQTLWLCEIIVLTSFGY